ncbi:hypothetical protein M3Y14_16165 [Bacillus thuringiensis]|uniref:hypothetical protein n=1 Tax=Bacillus thuringiensis TaxID=1428 RepID=UPI0022250305|nr:hypothetical protein [Bacillus thuringiensis]UYX50117.1 hypothetical protein M3Y14_16165 [Bacillus thuringiensis]
MAYYVDLNIFVAPNANSSNDRFAQMFIGAQDYWSQHGITLNFRWHFFLDVNPQNYWFAYTNEEYSADTLNNLLPYTQGVNEWIGLFFVGGNRLADGESTGCTSYVPIVQNGEITDFPYYSCFVLIY